MTKKQKLAEESDSEEYLHKAAWQVVLRQIEHAEANPTGSLYDDLVAMVFALHCIEGYLNFVGEKILPELWKDEKKNFSRTGIGGKLSKICECCGIAVPDKGRRPYSTVSELKKLRDKMAHPKTHRVRKKMEFVEDKPPPLFVRSYLASLVGHKKALRAQCDVKRIADEIHSAAVSRFPHVGLGPDALEGIQSMRTTSTRLIGQLP
jgi:hypothetical protein